jgi:hypothetical protein
VGPYGKGGGSYRGVACAVESAGAERGVAVEEGEGAGGEVAVAGDVRGEGDGRKLRAAIAIEGSAL